MTDENGLKPRTWNAVAVGALLIAAALAIILYWYQRDLICAFGTLLLVYGIYMAGTSFLKSGGESNFGPSDADAALAAGTVVAGVGVTCLVWGFTGEVLITVAVLIIILAVVGIIMAMKNRNV